MPDSTTNQLPPIPDPFYPDPDWATPTQDEWTLVEIKGGVELAKFSLTQRPCWLMGRAADQVHLPMQHPSISRCHARIAFDKSGTPWLRDCKSTHGVSVNKKRLPPEAVGVDESQSNKKGARGVVLFPGDVIQLGASTRLYCLEGPEQFQRGRIRLPPKGGAVAPVVHISKPAPQAKQQPETSVDPAEESKQEEEEQDAGGISWGISMEEAADHAEEESVDEAMKRQQALENVPEKHRKAQEKIQALKYKLQNVQTESERIRKKGDLTQGQENQLKRNAEREQQLGEQILQREKDLYDKLNPDRPKSRRRSHHHHHEEEDDDVDDFFDRTKDIDSNGSCGEGETEESLLGKWKDLKAQEKRKEQLLERAQQNVTSTQQRLERLEQAGDEEAFFAQNDLNLAKEQRDKLESGQETIQKELDETKRLLKIVNPSLVLEEQKKIVFDINEDGDVMMPPPMLPPPMRKPQADDKNNNKESTMMPPPMMPPPKRQKLFVAPSPPPAPDLKPPAEPSPPKKQSSKGKVKGPTRGPPSAPMGTLAALAAVSSGGAKDKNSSSNQEKKPAAIDLKKDEWRAPKDQDGSGITKLNAKFAGRY